MTANCYCLSIATSLLCRVDENQTYKELNEIYINYFMRGLINDSTAEQFISHHMTKIRMQGKGYWLSFTAKEYTDLLRRAL